MTAVGSPIPAGASEDAAGPRPRRLEAGVARVLTVGSLAGVAVLAVGVAAMALAGRDPLSVSFPAFDAGRLGADLVALRPEGLLWLGLVLLIATPAARVAASLVGFARIGDRSMTIVALAILAVIAAGVLVGKAGS